MEFKLDSTKSADYSPHSCAPSKVLTDVHGWSSQPPENAANETVQSGSRIVKGIFNVQKKTKSTGESPEYAQRQSPTNSRTRTPTARDHWQALLSKLRWFTLMLQAQSLNLFISMDLNPPSPDVVRSGPNFKPPQGPKPTWLSAAYRCVRHRSCSRWNLYPRVGRVEHQITSEPSAVGHTGCLANSSTSFSIRTTDDVLSNLGFAPEDFPIDRDWQRIGDRFAKSDSFARTRPTVR